MKDMVIIGSGGFSKQVIEIIEQINSIRPQYNLLGLIDDNDSLIENEVLGYKVIGDTKFLLDLSTHHTIYGVIAIADGQVRKKIVDILNDHVLWVNLIHPSATITKYKQLGEGNIICSGVIINPDFMMGNHSHINIGSTLGHDVKLKDYVTVMPGSRISGNVTIKSYTTVGAGSTIIQGLTLEENVFLGAGAVLTKNTIPNSVYIGVPAKKR